MLPEEAYRLILDKSDVTPQRVSLAKAHIVANFPSDTAYPYQVRSAHLIQGFAQAMEALAPTEVVVHPTMEMEVQVRRVGEFLACTAAAAEAISGLISSTILIPVFGATGSPFNDLTIRYTTNVGSGGASGSWDFRYLAPPTPELVHLAPSYRSQPPQPLSDCDLFLREIGIPDIDYAVSESLSEAVRCFRHELYLPCLAMLGRAVEGAWMELGLAMADHPPVHGGERTREFDRFIRNPLLNFAQLIVQVREYYGQQDQWQDVWRASRVSDTVMHNAAIWSDVVRARRNVLHLRADAPLPNNYETVGVLLLGAGRYLRDLYAARRAALSKTS